MTNRDKVVRAAYDAGYKRAIEAGNYDENTTPGGPWHEAGWQYWIGRNRDLVDQALSQPEAVREAMVELRDLRIDVKPGMTYKELLGQIQDAIRAKFDEANNLIARGESAWESGSASCQPKLRSDHD